MKKIFEAPEMKISVFEDSNILTASGDGVAAENSYGYSNGNHTVHSDWESMDGVNVVL